MSGIGMNPCVSIRLTTFCHTYILLNKVTLINCTRHSSLAKMSKRPKVHYEHLILHFDGCSKGNPGLSGAGWCLTKPGGRGVSFGYHFVGLKASNNVAEYRALIVGLQAAIRLGVDKLTVRGDSKLVVEQVTGNYKCSAPHLQPLMQEARLLMKAFGSVKIGWIPREKNAMADFLAHKATNVKESMTSCTDKMLDLQLLKQYC